MIAIFSFLSLIGSAFGKCPIVKSTKTGQVDAQNINEISGMVDTLDYLWVHNDSGDSPTLYALDHTGAHRGTVQIKGAFARDWEAMTSFMKNGQQYFLIGDVGDNKERKGSVTFYVLKAPTVLEDTEIEYAFTGTYDIGSSDVEALFVDPKDGLLYLFSKGRDGKHHILQGSIPNKPLPIENLVEAKTTAPPNIEFTAISSTKWSDLPIDKNHQNQYITDATIHSDGHLIVRRNYLSASLWIRQENQSILEAMQSQPCKIPLPLQPQGETIAFSIDGQSLWTISEGSNPFVYQIALIFE